ncbi:hypothetical protein FQN60_017351 [Etheostoma spectabile]|uniref:Dysbindin n=1 Tax=Etheostoma spectabile TaxID=54343 RepID=A0A5J5DF99_9PERO|nr:hypothetical protein FQN60_017351 [Etheostoma spectabile]
MFENFRERLHMVQQDFTTGYEESWFILHRRTKDCAQAAETVDGDIVMLSAHWERRRAALTQLQEQLQSVPAFISELDAITANIGDFEEMESRLVYLETLCCQCEQQTSKQHHINQLEVYKKKKRRELEALEVELNSEHAQKVAELEQATQQKLRERQKVYEEAFNQDVEHNISDLEALDDFLNSTADDISTGSSLTSGPDLESCSSESYRSQTIPAPPTHNQPSNQDAVWEPEDEVASEESDEPLVQSDEEDVQPDVILVGTVRGSDDSDNAGDMPSG